MGRKSSETRFSAYKVCKRGTCALAGIPQSQACFAPLKGGGTTDVCKECKRVANREAQLKLHSTEREAFHKRQREHFEANLRREQERWDSLPEGHPYKAPRRPG